MEDYDVHRLVPLFGQRESFGAERWVFPDLPFLCTGRLTGWRFRAASEQGASSPECRLNIGIWRLYRNSYRRLRTKKRPHVTTNRSLYTYELDSPVRVKPGDIMGIELNSYECSSVDNILSYDISGTGSSSLSFRTGTTLFIGQNSMTSTTKHSNLIPLIQPVFGKLRFIIQYDYLDLYTTKVRLKKIKFYGLFLTFLQTQLLWQKSRSTLLPTQAHRGT